LEQKQSEGIWCLGGLRRFLRDSIQQSEGIWGFDTVEVVSKKGNIYKVRKLHSDKEFYLVTDGKTHAHGETLKKAKEDFRFKIIADKLKKEPILADTVITINHYRLITGACEFGVKD